MRESIRKLEPEVHTSKSGRRYSRLNLGAIERVESGGYKLEGDVFATGGREVIHDVIEQFMERIDQEIGAHASLESESTQSPKASGKASQV